MICPYLKQKDYRYLVKKNGDLLISSETEHFTECVEDQCPYFEDEKENWSCKKTTFEMKDWEIKHLFGG